MVYLHLPLFLVHDNIGTNFQQEWVEGFTGFNDDGKGKIGHTELRITSLEGLGLLRQLFDKRGMNIERFRIEHDRRPEMIPRGSILRLEDREGVVFEWTI